MSGNRHDGAVAGLRLGKFSYRMVTEIVEAQPRKRAPDALHVRITSAADTRIYRTLELATGSALDCRCEITPCGAPTPLRLARVKLCRLTGGEHIMLRPHITERSGASVKRNNGIPRIAVKWNNPLSRFGLALANRERLFHQVNVAPAQLLKLAAAHRGIQGDSGGPGRRLPFRARGSSLEQSQLFVVGECPPYILANGKRMNLIGKQMPALRPYQNSTDDVEFPVDRGVGDAICFASADMGEHVLRFDLRDLHLT
ncbi:MAG TPA: hypothetical protein VFB24_01140 [Candidatus Binatia bacterium]|nr:hypothetical protein [Candidatus Binatia bacterium]